LWFDGSAFRKTGESGKIWSMVGMIHDLDPSFRSRLENLITFFHIGTSSPKNDLFCEKYLFDFTNLMENGLFVQINGTGIQLKFKILLVIADAVAYPKVFNCNQFNGFYGCIKCLHPVNSIKKPKQKRVYLYSNKYPLRSQIGYEHAVRIAEENKIVFQGISN
jgi:hypothetical protein